MICPKCGLKASNIKSRPRTDGVVYRRYRCRRCGARFSTYEMYQCELQRREYSMPCPLCYGSTNIVESRTKTDGSYRRTRVCTECGARFSTSETVNTKRQQAKRPSVEKFMDVALKRY